MKVTLTGYICVPEADLQQVLAALPEHVKLTKAEIGCKHFSVEQRKDDPYVFDVDEAFVDAEAFRLHQERVAESHWGRVTVNVQRHYQVEGLS